MVGSTNGTVVSANRTQINPTDPEAIVGFTPFASQAQGLNLTYQGVLTDPMFTAVLHALETTGDSRTLSVPRITTVNNSPALIRIGEDFRYFEEYDVVETLSGTTSEGRDTYIAQQVPVGTPTLEELGITLDVTPSVGADMTSITLRILPEISDFLRWEYWEVGTTRGGSARNNNNDSVQATATNVTSSIKLPIFQRSTLETEVVTRSGETVVMGGLIRSVESRSLEKVPILGDVPWLGRLFRHDTVEEKKQNLLIFVTGTILSETGETLVPPVDEIVAPPADETNVTAAAVAAVADAETAEGE